MKFAFSCKQITKYICRLTINFIWKGPKSIHSFRFNRMSSDDIATYLGSLPNRSNNDILGMDIVLLKESTPNIFYIIGKCDK